MLPLLVLLGVLGTNWQTYDIGHSNNPFATRVSMGFTWVLVVIVALLPSGVCAVKDALAGFWMRCFLGINRLSSWLWSDRRE